MTDESLLTFLPIVLLAYSAGLIAFGATIIDMLRSGDYG